MVINVKFKLSKNEINSFSSDVLALQLVGDSDLTAADIKWSAEGVAAITEFPGEYPYGFRDGVLVTLTDVGEGKVRAEYEGVLYECTVHSRERRLYKKGDKLSFFAGDLHAHTSHNHDYKTFPFRESEFPIDCYNQVKKEGLLDFFAMSDHAGVICKRDFFRGFTDAEAVEPLRTVIFPGCESQCNPAEIPVDRYGIMPKSGGELVSINSPTYINATDWKQFCNAFKGVPLPILSFAHPQIISWTKKGNGNFDFELINSPELIRLVKLIEMGNGGDRETNAINEYSYSVALDCGFKVSPCSTSDAHGPRWGYASLPGKTVIMAPDGSKEMLLDALYNNRVYATESGQVRLDFSVNGAISGETLPETDKYRFHIECSTFDNNPDNMPIRLRVISDGGETVKYIEGDMSSLDFELCSDKASYFYLRLTDKNGKKTWSAPIFTGRAPHYAEQPSLTPLDKGEFSAVDISTGKSAMTLINNDPSDVWVSENPNPIIVIDMKETKRISALGHYPIRPIMTEIIEKGLYPNNICTQYVSEYSLSVSDDGENYREIKRGILRVFGKEEFIIFEPCDARFLKFEVISSTGRACELEKYKNSPVQIGELTVF